MCEFQEDMKWLKCRNQKWKTTVLRYCRKKSPLKAQSDLHPKPERFSVPLTTQLKKFACGEWVAQFLRNTGNKNSVRAGCRNVRGAIRRERWQNETLCTFQPWNYRLVSPRQSPGVTDAIRACLDKRAGVHQHSHLSITARVCEMIASTYACRT